MVRLSVLNRHVLICCFDQCHTLSFLTDSYRWVCGHVSAVDFACLCMASDSIARRLPRFALALREGPCCGHGCCGPRVSGMLSFVMQHVCQKCPRTSWVDFRWGLLTTRRPERLRCTWATTQGARHSGASSKVRSQGQHTTQVFSIPSDCCHSSQGTSWTSSVAATSAFAAMQKSMNLFVVLP